jgi:hypothetical protein
MTKGTDVAQTTIGQAIQDVPAEVLKDFPVDVLERLVAMQEREQERSARMAFIADLAAFQDACPLLTRNKKASVVTKSGANYSYRYASLDRIAAEIRGLLTKHGLSYSWDSTTEAGMLICTCTLRHRDGHEVTSSFGAPIEQAAKMSGAQSTAATLTYARRQSLVSVLGLAIADEDTDARQGAPSKPITKSQAADIESLAGEVGADMARFVTWLGIDNLKELPSARFQEAVNALEAKRA